jgi:DNA-directed RNA polymerase subunit M
MQFCPKCGAILLPKKDGTKTIMACSCGYKSKEASATITESVKEKKPKLEIVEEEAAEAYPLVDKECPKCGHKKAYFWEIQTRASDEPATRFFKCGKCKYVWREYY